MAHVESIRSPGSNGSVEVLVHVDEVLDDGQRLDLVNHLESTDGIGSAEFCPLRYHLLLIQYNRQQMSSRDVLGHVTSRQVKAELIGPI